MNRAPLLFALLVVAVQSTALADPEVAASPLARVMLGRRVEVGTGGFTSGYGFEGGQWGDAFSTQQVEARWLFGGLTLEGGILNALPVASPGATLSLTGHLRLGWTWSRATVTVGALAQFAPGTPSTQLLPSITGAYAFDNFGLSAGLFDLHGFSIARVSFEKEYFGLGYVAPLGAEIHARLPVWRSFDGKVQALAFRAFNAQVAYLGISGVFDADKAVGGGDQ